MVVSVIQHLMGTYVGTYCEYHHYLWSLLTEHYGIWSSFQAGTTWECLEKAMECVKPGLKFRDVGNVIQKHAQSEGFSVVRSYCGHGEF